MSEKPVKRFKAPGPWITRELRDCVQASDYDDLASAHAAALEENAKLRSDLAARDAELARAREGFESLTSLSAQLELDRESWKAKAEANERDARRLCILMEDFSSGEVKAARDRLLMRMSVMGEGAIRAAIDAIDAAMKGKP